jgi:NRE family putative nickel resistance protein-like MFS transporter
MAPRAVRRTIEIFRVLGGRELRALWLADWISDAGSFVTFIALAVYIDRLTGSAAAVGFALALRSIPWFTIGPLAGVLADRMDRRKVMIGCSLIRAVLVGLLPFTREAWQAYALSFGSSLFGPVFRPARSAFLAQVAPRDRLVPALAVMETTHQVLHTVGPALGGLAVVAFGARNAFFVDAASFVVAAGFVKSIRPRGKPSGERRSTLHHLREGIHAVFAAPAVRTYALLMTSISLGFAGVLALLVVYFREVLNRPGGQYGIVLSVAGLGTVLASLAIAARDRSHSRSPWAVAAPLGIGVFALMWFSPSLLWLVPIAFVSGLADAGADLPMTAAVAETLGDEVRGRAYAAIEGLYQIAAAVGSLAFAWLGDVGRLGPARGLALAGAAGCLLSFVVLAAGGMGAIRRSEQARLSLRGAARPTTGLMEPGGPTERPPE